MRQGGLQMAFQAVHAKVGFHVWAFVKTVPSSGNMNKVMASLSTAVQLTCADDSFPLSDGHLLLLPGLASARWCNMWPVQPAQSTSEANMHAIQYMLKQQLSLSLHHMIVVIA